METYAQIGRILGFLSAIVSFVATWIYAATSFGLFGIVGGWIPAAVFAVISLVVVRYGWLPVAAVLGTHFFVTPLI